MSYDTQSDSSTDSSLPTCECCGEAYTHTTCDGANATRSCGCSTTPLTDGGRVPQSFEALAATCETCGGDVEPRYLEDGECPGCLYGEPLTDGGEDLLDVCPDCDGSSIKSNAGGGFGGRPSTGRGRYFCSDCGTHFEEPATRPRRGKPVRRGLAGKLADPDVGPDDLVTDGGQPTLTLDDDGLELPDSIDLSDGVVVRARGVTVDHKPGSPDRPRYPALSKRHLQEDPYSVANDHLDAFEVELKQYGQESETYHVDVLATDGGTIEHPGLEAVAAEEYDGTQECDYRCGSTAEYLVELRLEASSTTTLVCNDCSQQHRLWVEENDLLENTAVVDPLAKLAGKTEVEIACTIAMDAPQACDGWTETLELDDPARCENGRLKLPGFDWGCPECGNPSEFEIEGIRVSTHV